jgi:predicted O-methyltransferase YrrM
MKFFETAVAMAEESDLVHRQRPESLVRMRDAEHPTCLYYKFFDRLVCAFRPLDVLEIGTYVGTSAAHFAHSNYYATVDAEHRIFGQVITIDINPDAARCVHELGYPNITALVRNSLDLVEFFRAKGQLADVLYIDGVHNFSQAWREYIYYRDFVREGGLIMIDDAGLPMDGDEMNVLWELIPEPKQRVDHLHPNVGFGIVEKTRHEVPFPSQIADKADRMIKARRKIHR